MLKTYGKSIYPGIGLALAATLASAQIVRDGSVGPDTSVQPTGPQFEIPESHGAVAGSNLFHSFSEFNIGAGESATFSSSGVTPINNVISRVTGGSQSSIDGLLRSTIPGADFYLINPQGILFGENAQLDIDGAFKASTGATLEFAQGEAFETDAPAPILNTGDPARFGFLGEAGGPIVINSSNLSNPKGFEFAAGQVRLENGATVSSTSADGNDGSDILISATESVTLTGTNTSGRGSTLQTTTFSGDDGGNIVVNAPSIDFDSPAQVIAETKGSGQGGNINLSASEHITFSGVRPDDFDANALYSSTAAAGNAGDITLNTGTLRVEGGAHFNTWILENGSGKGGDIAINAIESISLTGTRADGAGVTLESNTNAMSTGNGGSVTLNAASIDFDANAQVRTDTKGRGHGGDINLTGDQISFSGTRSTALLPTGESAVNALYTTTTSTTSNTNAGAITIDATALRVEGGTHFATDTFGNAGGGDIIINAAESATFAGANDGSVDDFGNGSRLQSRSFGSGEGGNIVINTPILDFDSRAVIRTQTTGSGHGGDILLRARDQITFSGVRQAGFPANALYTITESPSGANGGAITIDTDTLRVEGGAHFNTWTRGNGKGGDISINATESATFAGANESGGGATLETNTDSAGEGGSINVSAPTVGLEDGAIFLTGSAGLGSSGDITLAATQSISLSGVNTKENPFPAALQTGASADGTNAGAIKLEAPDIALRDGARLVTRADGYIELEASERITLSGIHEASGVGAWLSAMTESETNGGSIILNAPVIEFDAHARVRTRTTAGGEGGDIKLTGEQITFSGPRRKDDERGLHEHVLRTATTSTTSAGNGGSISIDAGTLRVEGGAFITTDTSGAGAGGDIAISAHDSALFSKNNQRGAGSTLQASTSSSGDTGSISVEASEVSLSDGAVFFTTGYSESTGSTGDIDVSASQSLTLTGVNSTDLTFPSALQTFVSQGNAGTITVEAAAIRLEDGARFLASKAGPGTGGNIFVTATERFTMSGVHQRSGRPALLTTDTFAAGDAGFININTPLFRLIDGAQVTAATFGSGSGGNIIVNADAVDLSGGASISSTAVADGNAGSIAIRGGKTIRVVDDSTISTEAANSLGGNITLDAGKLIYLFASKVSTSVASGAGSGGNISVGPQQVPELVALNAAELRANAAAGSGGEINISVSEALLKSGDSVIDASAGEAGIDGAVIINSPETNNEPGEQPLTAKFLDASKLLTPRCGVSDSLGRFEVARRAIPAGAPPSIDAMLAGVAAPDQDAQFGHATLDGCAANSFYRSIP